MPSPSTDAVIPSSACGTAICKMPSAPPTAIAPTNAAGTRQMLAPPSCALTTPTLIIATR
jgi:hypothetical protein